MALCLAVALAIPALNVSIAQSVESALARIHDRYDRMTAMKASFNQVTTSTYLDEPEYYSGTILLSGDRYRIEMAGQTIVTNTRLTWVYNHTENQVLVNDYEEDPNTFSLTTFLSEFDSTYTAESYTREDDQDVVTLIPVDPLSSFRSVSLYTQTGIVRRLVVVDINDVQMDIQLSNIVFDPETTDQSFIFSIPDGAEVIDLRDN